MVGRIFCLGLLIVGKLLSAQQQPDSIFTTKGAVTLVNSKAPISTFQLGDGKNNDYDYRIVDNTLVFIRALVQSPKTTNLVIREGGRTHYLVIADKEHIELNKLKYILPESVKISDPNRYDNFYCPALRKEDLAGITAILNKQPIIPVGESLDSTLVAKIAEDFGRNRKAKRKYRVRDRNFNTGFVKAMTLSENDYFRFRIKDLRGDKIDLQNIHLLMKNKTGENPLKNLPISYWKAFNISDKSCLDLVIVTAANRYRKKDQIILWFEDSGRGLKSAYYLTEKALPVLMKE